MILDGQINKPDMQVLVKWNQVCRAKPTLVVVALQNTFRIGLTKRVVEKEGSSDRN